MHAQQRKSQFGIRIREEKGLDVGYESFTQRRDMRVEPCVEVPGIRMEQHPEGTYLSNDENTFMKILH